MPYLPIMLPSRALLLIHDYSRPITRPDWRNSKPVITTFRLYLRVRYVTLPNKLHENILSNIIDTEWHSVYQYIKYKGIKSYLKMNTDHNMSNADGMENAIQHYNWG